MMRLVNSKWNAMWFKFISFIVISSSFPFWYFWIFSLRWKKSAALNSEPQVSHKLNTMPQNHLNYFAPPFAWQKNVRLWMKKNQRILKQLINPMAVQSINSRITNNVQKTWSTYRTELISTERSFCFVMFSISHGCCNYCLSSLFWWSRRHLFQFLQMSNYFAHTNYVKEEKTFQNGFIHINNI